jgi:hypothetical protein
MLASYWLPVGGLPMSAVHAISVSYSSKKNDQEIGKVTEQHAFSMRFPETATSVFVNLIQLRT